MTSVFRFIFLSFLLIINPSVLGKESSKTQADHAFKLWTETCLDYSANYRELAIWARANNLRRVNAHFSKEILQGDKGEVWRLSHNQDDFFLVIAKPDKCSIWAPRADANRVNDVFEELMQNMQNKPELEGDKTIDGKGGEYRQIAYFTHKEDNPVGWVFIATTSASDTAEIQARLTMSRAKE